MVAIKSDRCIASVLIQGLNMINLVYVVAGNTPGAPTSSIYHEGAKRFASSFIQHPPEYEHRLFLIDSNGGFTPEIARIFEGIQYDVIPYHGSGWDIGAQFYAALTMSPDDWIMAFSSWAHFRRRGWLRAFAEARDIHGDGLYASTVSFENKPHVRGTGYFLRCGRFQRYPYGINSRNETFKWEWGPNSLTTWFVREGYGVWVVAPDGVLSLDEARTMKNNFRNGDQSNIWTFDKHTEIFELAPQEEKDNLTNRTWGPQSEAQTRGVRMLLHPLFENDFNQEIRDELTRLLESEEALKLLQGSAAPVVQPAVQTIEQATETATPTTETAAPTIETAASAIASATEAATSATVIRRPFQSLLSRLKRTS
jgi:hypothetical protein